VLTLSGSAKRGAGRGARRRVQQAPPDLAALPVPVAQLVLRSQPLLQAHDLLLQSARHRVRARARGPLDAATCCVACHTTPQPHQHQAHRTRRTVVVVAHLIFDNLRITLPLFGSERRAAGPSARVRRTANLASEPAPIRGGWIRLGCTLLYSFNNLYCVYLTIYFNHYLFPNYEINCSLSNINFLLHCKANITFVVRQIF